MVSLVICKYDWKNKTRKIYPGVERVFRVGDRVLCSHKGKDYSGEIMDVKISSFPLEGFSQEVFMKTDEIVSELEGALYDGFGLRGISYLFEFEDATPEELETRNHPYTCDIDPEELSEYKKLPPNLKRKIIGSGGSVTSLESDYLL